LICDVAEIKENGKKGVRIFVQYMCWLEPLSVLDFLSPQPY